MVKIIYYNKCTECQGKGLNWQSQDPDDGWLTCTRCDGTGIMATEISVRGCIVRGITNGSCARKKVPRVVEQEQLEAEYEANPPPPLQKRKVSGRYIGLINNGQCSAKYLASLDPYEE